MPFISSVRGTFGPQSENRGVGNPGPIAELLRQNPNSPALPSGGTITVAGGYRIHTFTSDGTFNPSALGNTTLPVEVLLVGGGGGSSNYTGGGGGGEVVTLSRTVSTNSTYPLTIGAGGNPSRSNQYNWFDGRHGSPSTGFGETAKPGGGGKAADDFGPSGGTFGSGIPPENGTDTRIANGGGGGSRSAGYFGTVGSSVGTGVTRFGGFRGGQSSTGGGSPNQSPNHPGGGGGGAGASVTGDSGNSAGSPGGIGVQSSILGINYFWGGGGGGSNHPINGSGGNGGLGGGGGGAASSSTGGGSALNAGGSVSSSNNGGDGGANTGGGAGGSGGSPTAGAAVGGSGIVVVRYQI